MTDNELAVALVEIDVQLRDLPHDYYDLNGMKGSAEKPAVQAIRKEITKWVDLLGLTNDWIYVQRSKVTIKEPNND